MAGISLMSLGNDKTSVGARGSESTVTVKTVCGTLLGLNNNGYRTFRGVPFAEPPVGSLRFKPPAKKMPWAGEWDATKFLAAPCQPGNEHVRQSEDCLYLNIWAPPGNGPFPVLVWIHGGGFTGGYAFDPWTDGMRFARDGIVVVTVAYRLGVFGFLDYGSLLGPEYAASGQNALLDLITALEWLQKNIDVFGGDPARVTIGGESAGAKLTDILMGVPLAEPLFHQMISESGGAERIAPRPAALVIADGFAQVWREQTAAGVQDLVTAPSSELILAQDELIARWPQRFPLRCVLGAPLIPVAPIESIRAGTSRGKRLLIGTNREESAIFDGPEQVRDVTPHDLGNMPLDTFRSVFSQYRNVYPKMSPKDLRIQALTAEEYWIPSLRVASAHVLAGGEAWMYRLDFAEKSGDLAGYAYHSLNRGMVWGRPNMDVINASSEAALGENMQSAWAAFIKGGAPAAAGLPVWPQYNVTSRPTLCLNETSQVEYSPQHNEMYLWDGVL